MADESGTRIIVASSFASCVKTGVFFSIENDDRVFTGDLFYDIAFREFQIRGIPAHEGRRRHVFDIGFRGPASLDMVIEAVGFEQVRPGAHDKYVDLTTKKGKMAVHLARHIEEWHGDQSVMSYIDEFWAVVPNLIWTKG